jgi:hypothetical protein
MPRERLKSWPDIRIVYLRKSSYEVKPSRLEHRAATIDIYIYIYIDPTSYIYICPLHAFILCDSS